MRKPCPFLVVLLSACLGFAPAPVPKTNRMNPRNVMTQMQGTWEIVSVERSGGVKGISTTLQKLQVNGNRWTYFFKRPPQAGVSPSTTYQLKLNATNPPAHLDLERPRDPDWSISGIVQIEKDTMRFLYVLPARRKDGRPKAFGKVNPGQIMMTYRRMK